MTRKEMEYTELKESFFAKEKHCSRPHVSEIVKQGNDNEILKFMIGGKIVNTIDFNLDNVHIYRILLLKKNKLFQADYYHKFDVWEINRLYFKNDIVLEINVAKSVIRDMETELAQLHSREWDRKTFLHYAISYRMDRVDKFYKSLDKLDKWKRNQEKEWAKRKSKPALKPLEMTKEYIEYREKIKTLEKAVKDAEKEKDFTKVATFFSELVEHRKTEPKEKYIPPTGKTTP